ncbi:glycosyl hydrolase family 95 catalytic domain-containing protein [Paenibacillus sp. FSL R5-0914]|uniref:glycosyl hydrolase family 95 catalytic domain-containing protein n=1 Tax=Paenibacillus sp. FSL R5-0914 TaxID=2921665 RepID=UPI0030F5C502
MFKIKSLAKRLIVSALSLSLIIQHPLSIPIAKANPVSAITGLSDAPEHKLSLWYRQPAINWETDALPIGNGLMGGMIFGGIEQERIQLNEKTLWSGGPGSSFVYTWPSTDDPTTSIPYTFGNREGGADHLESVRAKLRAGDIDGAHKEADENLTGLNEGLGSYLTFGDLYLDFEKSSTTNVENYRRELDLEDAISRVKYTLDGVEYTREYFVSYPDKVMVTRLTANQPGKLSLDVRPTSAQGGTVTANGNNINIRGNVLDNNMLYEGNFRVLNQGGNITSGNGKIHAANVDSLTILTSLGTNYANSYPNYRGTDPHNEEVAILDAAESKSYETLLENHKKDYKSLFDRMKLDLGESKPTIPTDELLATYAGTKSKALEVLFYQYGRYLLISSSRPGSLPANLQGVWNNSNRAPWSSDHHFNINIQMNYWPAMVTNLSETMTPLIDYIDSLRTPGRISSEKYYGITNAWSIGVANNPFGYTAPGWNFDWGWSPASNAFISNNIWESYKFSGDVDLLKSRVYPILKETTRFWTQYLVEDTDGTLVSTPCYSPEQGTISTGCAYDQQLVQDLFTNYLEASTTLAVDSDFREEVQSKLNQVSPIKIGKYGQIQEWKEDIDDPNNKHRHLSQLVALYPGKQINKNTPELMEAARVSLQHRGDEGTGWSKANKINMWARAQDGTHAHTILEGQLTGSTLNNLFDTHPPFQIDGNFGATSGMSEMLLQSHLDNIDVLPALPASWPKGSYSGLVARGGFEVSVNWNNARATSISVKSNKGNRAVVSYPSIAGATVMNQAGQNVKYSVDNNNQISFDTQVGDVYTIGSIPLQDGQLLTMTMKNSGHLLDIEGASEQEQAAVVQMTAGSLSQSQQWYAESVSDGYYKITNSLSSKVIAVLNESMSDGAKLVQQTYTSDNSYHDEWLLVDKGNGYSQLVNRGSGKAITASNTSTGTGIELIQSSITDSDEQLVRIDPVRDFFDQQKFNLTIQHSNLRMDVNEDSKSDGAAIIQWSESSGQNQQWMFMKTTPGYYKIISMSSSKVLAVENASTADGAGIIQATFTDDATYNDEWSVVDAGDGYYQLRNRASGKVIDMPNNSVSSGEQFVQNKAGKGSNQKFAFSLDRTVNDNATGSGNDQFVYGSGWEYSGFESGAYNRDNHYSNETDSYAFLRFNGSKVQLYGAKNNNQGIVAFSIDDGPEQLVDTYASSRLDQQLLFESSEMLNQEHVLKIRVTDQKNDNSNNTYISVDRADIQSRVVKSVDKAEDYYIQTIETINGVNHSVITLNYNGEDAGDAVRAAIEAAKAAQKPVILDFPTETYHFKALTANQVQYFISNTTTKEQTPSSTRKVGLIFKDIDDLTIRGNGSTLLFHGVMTPIVFDHATNIKVNGINIDFNRPVVSEMTVTEVGNNYMKASIHPDSWYSIQNNQLVWFGEENWTENGTQNVRAVQEYNPATKQTWRVANPLDGTTSTKDLGKREVQFNFTKSPNLSVGNTFQFRDTTRREQGALIYRSKNIAWSDVDFYAAPGLGIISQYSENVSLDNLNFAPKTGSGRTNASMADFLQVSGGKGEIRVLNSYFSGAHDDAINIHGTHLQIVQVTSSNQVKVQFMHPESWGFDAFAVGDTIEYINKSTLLSKESAVVTDVTRLNDTQIVLTLDKPVPSSITANEYVVENATWTPNVTVKNSTFESIPTRGLLVTTRGSVRIENNTFNGMQMSAILIAHDASSWYESGMVKDVLIRNNRFNNNSNAVISIDPNTSLTNPDKTVHSHIEIDGNQFNKVGGNSEIYAKSVDGLTFTNNTANQGGIELTFDASKAVTVTGNSFKESDVDKKINFNRMIPGTDSVEATQGFIVTRTNDYTPAVTDPNDIPQSEMTASSTSNRSGNEADNAIDGNPSTIWHTEWDPMADLPQSITLDLGNTRIISKLKYLPRQNGEQNGNITSYVLSTSLDGTTFKQFTSGSWDDDSTEKIAEFAPVASRYLRLTAIEGHGGLASAAEINIMKNEMDEDYQALKALITRVQSKHDGAVEGTEDGQYPEGSKLTLQKAIDQAKKVRDSLPVTQQQLQQAASDLTAALQVMEDSINKHEMVQSITITSESSVITAKNGTLQLGATVLPANATKKSVIWSVHEVDGITATDKATINQTGLLTAVKDGTVKVIATATDGSGVHDEMDISISGQTDIIDPGTDPVNVGRITITSSGNVSTITAKNGTLQLGATVLPDNATNKSVTWAVYGVDGTTETDIATIDVSGLLTAVKDGTVKVVATAVDGSGVQGDMVITISGQTDIIDPGTDPVNVEKINITSAGNVSTITAKNVTLQLGATVLPDNATNKSVTWAVFEADGRTPTNKAIIDVNGLLTAVKNGTVKVVASAMDGSAVHGFKEIVISGQNDTPDPTSSPEPTPDPGTNPGNPTTSTRPTPSPTPTIPPTKEDPHRYIPTTKELQSETAQNGTTSLTINIDMEALAKKLEALNKTTGTPNLDIEIPGVNAWNAVHLPLDVLYNSMKTNKEIIIAFRNHLGSYELPLANLNREELEKAAKVAGATLIIQMDNATSQHEQKFEQSIVEKGMKRVSDIIAYKVILKSNDKEEELQRFGNPFMSRVINMDSVIQDPSTATAVIFDPVTGQMRFVPSVFTVKDGRTEVTIFGQANGLYTIVQNKKTFDDMVGHWAQKDVETLASKLIINGMTDRTFNPSSQVSRAQFTVLLVRGLGLTTDSLSNVFTDVGTTKWYAKDVNTAAKLGLVQGVSEGKFSPDTMITREQMIVMIMKAIHLVQDDHGTEAQVRTPFADQDLISDYASNAVTEAASKGLIKGKTETTLAPQDAATRAEATLMIKQLLQYLKFMN